MLAGSPQPSILHGGKHHDHAKKHKVFPGPDGRFEFCRRFRHARPYRGEPHLVGLSPPPGDSPNHAAPGDPGGKTTPGSAGGVTSPGDPPNSPFPGDPPDSPTSGDPPGDPVPGNRRDPLPGSPDPTPAPHEHPGHWSELHPARVGERVVVNARLRNSGVTKARQVRVRFFAGGRQIGQKTVSLAPGVTKTVSTAFVADSPGTQNIQVRVDPGSGAGKQVVSSRSLTVKSAPSSTVATARGQEETSESQIAQVPDYQGPLKKPQTKVGIDFPKQKPPAGKDKDKEGSGPGSDRYGVPESPLDKGLPDLESPPGKRHLGDKGDGIMGIHDQEGTPENNLGKGIPKVPDFRVGFPTGKGEVDGGAYGGINPKYMPGGVYKDPPKTDEGKSKLTTPKVKDAVTDEMLKGGASMVFEKDGNVIGFYDKGKDGYAIVYGSDGGVNIMNADEAALVFGVGTGKPGPEGKDKVHPRQDPQLMAKLSKLAEQQKAGKLRPDESLIDPRPVKTSTKTAEAQAPGGQVASVTSTQAGAEAKWKFIGVKPGSGVTDPAEPMGPKGPDTSSGIKPIKHFEVIDPAEPEAASLQAALAKAQISPAKGTPGKTATVASVTGTVQKLTEQGGKQGWAPLKPGDNLGQGSIIRVDRNTGGEVGFGDLETALSQNFSKIHGTSNHTVYLVKVRE